MTVVTVPLSPSDKLYWFCSFWITSTVTGTFSDFGKVMVLWVELGCCWHDVWFWKRDIVVAWLILAEVMLSCLFICLVCHVGEFCSLVH
jgi:hypothetical protein